MRTSAPRLSRVIYRNLAFIWLFNMVWALGNPMVNSATMVASFFDKLGSNPFVFGLLQVCASLPVLIQFLPRLVAMGRGNLKSRMVAAYMATGAGYILYGIVAHFCQLNPAVYVPVMLGLYFMVFGLYQLAYILYLDYIMRLFPADILGRFYGFNGLFMSIGAIAGGAVAGVLLKAFGFPANYGNMFMLAGVIFILSTALSLFTVPHQDAPAQSAVPGIREYGKYVLRIFRLPPARYFAALILLIYVNMASYGFALIFMNRELKINVDPTTATLIAYVSQSVLLMVVGISLDKLGRLKTVSAYMTLVMIANVVILLPFRFSYVVVFAAYGMYALFISMVKVRLANEVVPADQRLDLVIVANVLGVVVSSLVSLGYGAIAQATGSYWFMFVVSAASVAALYPVAARLGREIKKLNSGGSSPAADMEAKL